MRRCVGAVLIVGLAVGCKFDEATVPARREDVVVHAVLDPGRFRQVVLVERTLTGRVPLSTEVRFDSLDPIASRGGVPVTGARVVVQRGGGDSAELAEMTAGSADRGTGVYEFLNSSPDSVFGESERLLEVLAGETYHLRITTPDGRNVTASTTIPGGVAGARDLTPKVFNRDRESRFLFWQVVPGAARFEIAATSPRAPFRVFVDSLEFQVSGTLKNTASGNFEDVFVPGFTQSLTASAVDRNYFDYYRSKNDEVTGRGLLNHVSGGLGVFGSIVVMRDLRLKVTADQDEPIEGQYERVAGAGPRALQLFITGRQGARVLLSGNYEGNSTISPGLLGVMDGNSVSLALLRGQSARDTALVLDGRLEGGLFRGQIRSSESPVEYQHVTPPMPSRGSRVRR